MPKMKARSTAKKRFRRLSSGLVKCAKAFRRHLLTSKTTKRKRNMRRTAYVMPAETRKLVQLLSHR